MGTDQKQGLNHKHTFEVPVTSSRSEPMTAFQQNRRVSHTDMCDLIREGTTNYALLFLLV